MKFGIIAFCVLVLCIVSLSSCNVVSPGNRGVKVFLGSVQEEVLTEGLHFKCPFLSNIIILPVQQITQQTQAICFSSDLQRIDLNISVLYRIPEENVVKLYQQYKGDPYQMIVEPRIQEAIKQEVSQYVAEEVVKQREKIKQVAIPNIKENLSGLINIIDIVITNVDLSDILEQAIEQKQVKQQEALAKVYELQKAEKEAQIAIATAKGEAESIRLKAEAISKSPEVIQLEIIKKWDGKAPQYVSTNGGGNMLLPMK